MIKKLCVITFILSIIVVSAQALIVDPIQSPINSPIVPPIKTVVETTGSWVLDDDNNWDNSGIWDDSKTWTE